MNRLSGSVLHRFVLYVSLGLFVFAILAGALIYRFTFQQELDDAASLERQLVSTVQAQAEVAAFAANTKIAEDVLEGLRANPRIRAARITGIETHSINMASGTMKGDERALTIYPLFSPVDGKERIGILTVVRNDPLIQAEATMVALRQTLLLLAQLATTAVLILLTFRQLLGKPIAKLVADLAAIKPGDGQRVVIDPIHAHDEIGYLAASANALIAAAEQALEEVNALATTDSLTGLLNRRAFMERLGHELSRLQRQETIPACVLMFDLDHFKQINDAHGHAAGDTVLREFGTLLGSELRKIDTAGRLGGEEFAAILPHTGTEDAVFFAERLRSKIADLAIAHDRKTLRISTSIGVAAMSHSDAQPDEVLARADRALYQAKEVGRNRVVVADENEIKTEH